MNWICESLAIFLLTLKLMKNLINIFCHFENRTITEVDDFTFHQTTMFMVLIPISLRLCEWCNCSGIYFLPAYNNFQLTPTFPFNEKLKPDTTSKRTTKLKILDVAMTPSFPRITHTTLLVIVFLCELFSIHP